MPLRKLVFWTFSFFSTCATAQTIDLANPWVDFNVKHKLTDQLAIGGDMGYRTVLNGLNIHQLMIRPTLFWKPNQAFTFDFAISDWHTFDETTDVHEFRLAQQMTIRWPKVPSLKLDHRFRFEERFFFVNGTRENANRFRYRLAVGPPDFKIFKSGNTFYALGSWEAFLPISSSFKTILGSNQRWEIMLGYHFSPTFHAGFHFIPETSHVNGTDYDLAKYIYRLRLHLEI